MDNDLISRSALGIGYANPLVFDDQSFVKGWNMAIEIIAKAPAVDAVEVVRCKKCQHYNKQYKSETEKCCTINAEYDPDIGVWYGFTAYPPPDFYCADGERRSDGT